MIKNNCIDNEYSLQVTKTDIEYVFVKGDRFSNVSIDQTLLHTLKNVVQDSHKVTLDSYKSYDKFMIKMRRQYKYNLIVSKTNPFILHMVSYRTNTFICCCCEF